MITFLYYYIFLVKSSFFYYALHWPFSLFCNIVILQFIWFISSTSTFCVPNSHLLPPWPPGPSSAKQRPETDGPSRRLLVFPPLPTWRKSPPAVGAVPRPRPASLADSLGASFSRVRQPVKIRASFFAADGEKSRFHRGEERRKK